MSRARREHFARRAARTLLLLLLVSLTASPCPGEVIYSYKDADGVMHFTNKRTREEFRPYFYFMIPRNVDRGVLWAAIKRSARIHGVDPALIAAMVEVESGFCVTAVSPKGAMGPMQIMPGTAQDLGLTQPFDPSSNIEAGTRYFKDMLTRFGDPRLALAAYNAGPGRVEAAGGIPGIAETKAYVVKVMGIYQGQPKSPAMAGSSR